LFAAGGTEFVYGNMFEIVAVPEPSTWAAAGLSLLTIAYSQRLSDGMQTAPLQISMVTVVKRFIAFYGIICANLNSEKFLLGKNYGSAAPPARRGFHVNAFKSLFAGLVIAAAASAVADTINFDDLNGSGDQTIQNGYAGLNWDNVYIYDATNDPAHLNPSGYQFSVISPNNVAFNGFGNSATVSSDTVFNLNSAYLTAVWRDNLQVEVIGSLLGAPIYDNTYSLSATEATLINFNYLGIDSVQVSIFSAGSQHPEYNFNGTQVAIDNLNVDFLTTLAAVPEPSTWLAAALALGVIGFSQRKRVRARASFAVKKHF